MDQADLIYEKPERSDYGIGIVGAGGIVNGSHIPAYRKAGLNIVAICDVDENKARVTAERYGIKHYYANVRQLIERDDIQIVDIAIPNEGRVEIVREAVAAGKHVLIQKPFAHTIEQAVEMVAMAEAAGVKLAVNQNARFAPFYKITKDIIDSGILGTPYLLTHEMRINQEAALRGRWFAQVPDFLLVDYEIHHIDLMRYWSGSAPVRVYCSTTKMPGQQLDCDMIALTTMDFENGLRCQLTTVDTTQSNEHFWRFSVEGTKGSLYGRIEDGYKNPDIQFYSTDEPHRWIRPVIAGTWFPDAFYGVMFELMRSIQEDRDPSHSGTDNLQTLQLLHAAIRSSKEHRVVSLD